MGAGVLGWGFRAGTASGKSTGVGRPRGGCRSAAAMARTSRPSNRTWPLKRALSIRLSVESAVTVFPEADSPTSASFSPASSEKLTRSTTRRGPKSMLRSRTSSRLTSFLLALQPLARVERVAQRVADEDQQQQHHDEHGEGRQGDPPCVEVVLALAEQLAQARRAERHAQVQEI